ncbi:MAG: DUF2254 domain-containing protein [Rhizobiaceae bacterium]|nr:DUF2254 domain-containing protein [Rhizobiaceae bacterium]
MTSRWRWLLLLTTRRLWFRATVISLLAFASALLAFAIAPYVPAGLAKSIGADSVETILTIIASSMLTVTTFSLSTMVSAYSAATSNVTPRATKLLIEDTTTQNVLATFVGSFLFSLVAIITLSMGAYGERGRVVLFAVTILVVLLIVVTLLRWIDYLLRFGRVGETTRQVEKATEQAMRFRQENPFLGGLPLIDPASQVPAGSPVAANAIGYVQHVDMGALQDAAESAAAEVYLMATPGTFVDHRRPLALLAAAADDALADRIRGAFTISDTRTFDQDPRFGLSVMSEIASRALSPAVNDPGTAIDVIGRAVRVLWLWTEPSPDISPRHPRIHVPPILPGDLFDDFFHPIARDGAAIAEVQIRLQKAFAALAGSGDERFRVQSLRHSRAALRRAETAMTTDLDVERVRAAAATVEEAARPSIVRR